MCDGIGHGLWDTIPVYRCTCFHEGYLSQRKDSLNDGYLLCTIIPVQSSGGEIEEQLVPFTGNDDATVTEANEPSA